jgi:hypothetical protein
MQPRRTSLALGSAAAALAVVGALATAAPAQAGPPGSWTTISGGGISNISEPGLYRTADGTLHVAITSNVANTNQIDISHISASGALTGRSSAINGWASTTYDPDLVAGPGGGMRLVFGGQHTTVTGDPYNEGYVYLASSDASGGTWTLASNTTPAIASPQGYGSYGTGVTTLADGTLVSAYPLNATVTYQVGGNPPQSFTHPACCVYDMSLVNDGGTVWAAYYANGSSPADQGVFVRTIYPTLGPAIQAPGSVTNGSSLSPDQAVAMVARAGGGVYLAYLQGYPTAKNVALWKVGTPSPKKVKHSKGADQVSLSAGVSGQLWLAFNDGHNNVGVVHTNAAASELSPVQTVRTPKGSTIYDLGIAAGTGRGDVVFNNGTAILHTQVFPGLGLKASPHSLKAGKPGKVTFTVTDAGAVVKGAKVKAKGKSCKTDKHGKCSITFPGLPAKSFDVRATAGGYGDGSVSIKVKK